MVKNPPANAGGVRHESLIPGLGRFLLELEMATHSSILAWKIPRQRSLVGYSLCGCKESDMTEPCAHVHTHTPRLQCLSLTHTHAHPDSSVSL